MRELEHRPGYLPINAPVVPRPRPVDTTRPSSTRPAGGRSPAGERGQNGLPHRLISLIWHARPAVATLYSL